MFQSEQGFIPGSEPQNYDDILRKQKVFSQCREGECFIVIIRYSLIALNITKYVREYGH